MEVGADFQDSWEAGTWHHLQFDIDPSGNRKAVRYHKEKEFASQEVSVKKWARPRKDS